MKHFYLGGSLLNEAKILMVLFGHLFFDVPIARWQNSKRLMILVWYLGCA